MYVATGEYQCATGKTASKAAAGKTASKAAAPAKTVLHKGLEAFYEQPMAGAAPIEPFYGQPKAMRAFLDEDA